MWCFDLAFAGIGKVLSLNAAIKMNSNDYLEILGDHVQPAIDFYFPNGNGIFRDDNARIHRARKVENLFETLSGSFQHCIGRPSPLI